MVKYNEVEDIDPSKLRNIAAGGPLEMLQPMNIFVLLTYYSPLFLALGILSLSLIFQNFKGLMYLVFFLGVSMLREFILMISGSKPNASKTECDVVKFSTYGNSTYSIFAFAFTIIYICLPMFMNHDVNWATFGALLVYFLIDIGLRFYKHCIVGITGFLTDLLGGALLGVLITMVLYSTNNKDFLFFNEISSNKDVCSMPKKTQFRCNVYKNGELIGSANQ
jgi:hypothetical protein